MLNKAQKLVKMVELMQRRGGVRAGELLRRFEIDPRTLRRYLADLRELGLPIEDVDTGPDRTISLDPKGITALSIDGLKPIVSFQNQLFATKPIRPVAMGKKTKAMVFSFGPGLRWVYAYLKTDPKAVREARSRITFDEGSRLLHDATYPFEFSAPLPAKTREVEVEIPTSSN